jgi:hypothetical protein
MVVIRDVNPAGTQHIVTDFHPVDAADMAIVVERHIIADDDLGSKALTQVFVACLHPESGQGGKIPADDYM